MDKQRFKVRQRLLCQRVDHRHVQGAVEWCGVYHIIRNQKDIAKAESAYREFMSAQARWHIRKGCN